MKSRSELALNGSARKPCLRQALSESHISGESFPRLSRSESGTILEILRCPLVHTSEQLDQVSCPSLSDSYDERLMQLLDCHRSPKYLNEATGSVYAPYHSHVPLECDTSISEILSRTCNEICTRFSKLKRQLLGVQGSASATNAQEPKSPSPQQNDPEYFFGTSESFPTNIVRRPEMRRINFSQSVNNLHQTDLNNITPPSQLQDISTPLPQRQLHKMPLNQSGAMSSGYYSNTSNDTNEHLTAVSPELCASYPQTPIPTTLIHQPNIIYSEENLNDVSIPTYAEFSRRDHSYPSEMLENISSLVIRPSTPRRSCICKRKRKYNQNNLSSPQLEDISAPSFKSSQCLEDQSLATQAFVPIVVTTHGKTITSAQNQHFEDNIEASPRLFCEQISDVSTPSFKRTRVYMTNECLEDVSKPSQFTSTPQSQQRPQIVCPTTNAQNSIPSEKLEDISMPCSPNINHSRGIYYNLHRSSPGERIVDVSEPFFESTPRSMFCPMHAQERRQYMPRKLPSQCQKNMSSPDLGQYSACSPILPNEFLINESMPSYSSPLDCSRRQRTNQCQMSFPSENLDNVSSPRYDANCSRQEAAPANCFRPINQRLRELSNTYSSENLNDVSVPEFENSSPRQNQQPRFIGSKYCRPINQRQREISNTYSSENLNDVSVPVFEQSSPRQNQQSPLTGSRYCRLINQRQREISNTYSSENLNDISVPMFEQSSPIQNQQSPLTDSRYCRPNNHSQRGISKRYSLENLNDISVPRFEQSSPIQNQQSPLTGSRYCRLINHSQREISNTYSSENLNDVSVPVFEKSSAKNNYVSHRPDSRIYRGLSRLFSRHRNRTPMRDNQTQYSRQSPVHHADTNRRQIQNQYTDLPSECLDDIPPPDTYQFSASNRSQSEYLNDISMPSMDRCYEQTPVRCQKTPKSIPKQRDVSASSYNRTGNKSVSNHQSKLSKERIRNMSKSDLEKIKRRLILPTERIEDQSMPSMAGSPQITSTPIYKRSNTRFIRVVDQSTVQQNETSKSFANSQIAELVNCLNNMLVSHFGVTISPQTVACSTQEQLNDVTIPTSFDPSSRYLLTITPNEQIQDVTMPSLSPDTPVSACLQTPVCVTGEKLEDISMPTLEECFKDTTNDCAYPDESGVNFDINNQHHRGAYVGTYSEDESPPRQLYAYELTTSPINNEYQLIENESPPRFIITSRTPSGTESDDSKSDNKKSKMKRLLHTTKEVFSRLGEDKQTLQSQTLSADTTKPESTPVVPIPGTLKSIQNLRTFLATNKTADSDKLDKSKKFHDKFLDSISQPDFSTTQTSAEATNLEDISAPNFNSTSIESDHPSENSKEVKTAALPSPGTIKGFKNLKTLAELARNKVKEREKRQRLESARLEDINSPTLNVTPSQSLKTLDEQTPTTSAQQSKNERQKRKGASNISKIKATQESNVDYVENTTAPSFASTPESIPQMRNYKTSSRSKNDVKHTTPSIPQMRTYSTPKEYNEGSPTNKSYKYQSSTSLGSPRRHAPTSREQQQKSTQMIKNSRTHTPNVVIWNEIEARRLRGTSTQRQPQTCQPTQPAYDFYNRYYQDYVPSYCNVNYDASQTESQPVVYECCCENCERRWRRRSC